MSDACPASREYPTQPGAWPGARRVRSRTPRPRPKARRESWPSVVWRFRFEKKARKRPRVFGVQTSFAVEVPAPCFGAGRESVGGLRSEGRDAWSSGRGWRHASGIGRVKVARSRFRARASPLRDDAPVEARWVFRHIASRKGKKRQKARIGTRVAAARFANARGLARAGFSSRVPSSGRRESVRACFASLDVALRRVSEPGVPRAERENRTRRKISRNPEKNGG